jgi:hypothetical protein
MRDTMGKGRNAGKGAAGLSKGKAKPAAAERTKSAGRRKK